MTKLWRNTIVCSLIAVLFIAPISAIENFRRVGTDSVSSNILDGGWLEEQDDLKILHVNGSYYEMGFQHGVLLKDEIQENMRMIGSWFDQNGFSPDDFLEIWDMMNDFIPQKYKEEIQGIADGIGISFEEVAIYNTWSAVINHALLSCCNAAAWSSATENNKLYHMRSLDIIHPAQGIKDPETGTFFRENQILIVRKPNNGYASVYPEFAGSVCSWGGINEKGIAIGADTCLTNDSTFKGISAAFRMRMVLDYASTAEEAINIMTANRTCGWNFIISDGKIPEASIIEQTANLEYIASWSNPIESTTPFWKIENIVRRGPMFISPECSATQPQRKHYDPSGFRGFFSFIMGQNRYFTVWSQYKALSDMFEQQWGTLNVNSTMSLLRDVYLGKTDLVFSLMQKSYLFSFQSLHQWVACPETGDIVISFAEGDSMTACKNPVHYFNLFDLMNTEPHNDIEITRPQDGYLYIGLREIISTPSKKTLIIGRTPVKVSASQEEDAEKVEFYLDDQLIETVTETPFAIMLDETAFWKHTILAKAYYTDGSTPTDWLDVTIFNI